MWVENLQQWLEDAREEEKNDATNWIRVIELVRTTFQDGRLSEGSLWQTMFLITKGGGSFWWIVFVEVLWKIAVVILDLRLGLAITLHDMIHGLQDT